MATNIEILDGDESAAEVAQQIKLPGTIVESSGKVTVKVDELESANGDQKIYISGSAWKFYTDGSTEKTLGESGMSWSLSGVSTTQSPTAAQIESGIAYEISTGG